MPEIPLKSYVRKSLSRFKFLDKHIISMHDRKRIVALLSLILIIGCTPQSTHTPDVYPTSMASCFPDSVFTAENMRARVACQSAEYKMEITEDTVVLFAFPDPLLDWSGPIFVIHIPSVSEVVLSKDGSILFEGYKSSEGQQTIENVLTDQALMTSILERTKEIEKQK